MDAASKRHFDLLFTHEDADEKSGRISAHDRITCRTHRRWIHQCIGSPLHAVPVTGHRWCPRCASAVWVSVDEVSGTVVLTCDCRDDAPSSPARKQIELTCRASLQTWLRYNRSP